MRFLWLLGIPLSVFLGTAGCRRVLQLLDKLDRHDLRWWSTPAAFAALSVLAPLAAAGVIASWVLAWVGHL